MNEIRLQWFVPTPIAMVAQARKMFDGVEIRTERNLSSDAQFEALRDGHVDAVVTAMDNVMDWNLRAGPRDFRVLAQVEHTTPLTLMGRPGLQTLADLRGARLLVDAPRNGFVVALLARLAQAGLTASDYELVPAGGVSERFDALRRGCGDATLLGPPFDAMAASAGLPRLASVQDWYPAFPGQGLVASAASLARLQAPLSAWMLGLNRARDHMAYAPDDCTEILLEAGFPPPAVKAMLGANPVSLVPDRAGVELLIAQRRSAGLPGADVSYSELVSLPPPP